MLRGFVANVRVGYGHVERGNGREVAPVVDGSSDQIFERRYREPRLLDHANDVDVDAMLPIIEDPEA